MQISSASNSFQRFVVQPKPSSTARTDFSGLIAAADQAKTPARVQLPDANLPVNAAKPNFSSMSPSEFRAQAKAMYDRGEIDIATLGPMVMRTYAQDEGSDTFASVGGGKFDYTEIFKSAMAFVAKQGRQNDPTSGYAMYGNILSKIS